MADRPRRDGDPDERGREASGSGPGSHGGGPRRPSNRPTGAGRGRPPTSGPPRGRGPAGPGYGPGPGARPPGLARGRRATDRDMTVPATTRPVRSSVPGRATGPGRRVTARSDHVTTDRPDPAGRALTDRPGPAGRAMTDRPGPARPTADPVRTTAARVGLARHPARRSLVPTVDMARNAPVAVGPPRIDVPVRTGRTARGRQDARGRRADQDRRAAATGQGRPEADTAAVVPRASSVDRPRHSAARPPDPRMRRHPCRRLTSSVMRKS